MTIRRLLKDSKLARQEVERLNTAYRDVLVDRNDPIAEIVAKTVIEIGATGVNEPSEISKIAIKRLCSAGAGAALGPFRLNRGGARQPFLEMMQYRRQHCQGYQDRGQYSEQACRERKLRQF
jgi:hypothetical protein